MRLRSLAALAVVLATGPLGWAAGAGYEPAPTLKAADLLAKEQLAGPRFKVTDAVKCDGYMTGFTLQSDFGSFDAASREMLEVRIREVAALVKLEDVSKTDAFAQAFAASAKKKAAAVGNVVANPVETAKGVPEGVGRFFKGASKKAKAGADSAKDAATGSDKDAAGAQKPEAEDVAKDAAGVSKVKRQWSQKLGIDPYTSNAVLNKKLDDIAWAAYAGGFAMNVVAAPVPGLNMVTRANDLAWSLPPQELAALNDGKLTKMGVSPETRKAFLKNRFFTPSLQTQMVVALEAMPGVTGIGDAIALAASQTDSEEDARFYRRTALLLAQYQAVEPIASLQARQRIFVGHTKSGTLVVPGALDYVTWTPEIDQFASDPTLKAAKREIWLSGRASAAAAKELASRGWKLRESTPAN
jgi:hypothetical protein